MTKDHPAGNSTGEGEGRRADERQGESRVRVVDRRWWVQGGESAADDQVPSLKPSYVEELEQQLAEKDRQLQDHVVRYREAAREFDESRIRVRREVARDVERARRAFIGELLEVLDNLDRAIEAGRKDTSGHADALVQGIELVRQLFLTKLEGIAVRKLAPDGQAFDPERHEAITTVSTTDPTQDNIVVGVAKVGYTIGDEILRPALVAVARYVPADTEPSPTPTA